MKPRKKLTKFHIFIPLVLVLLVATLLIVGASFQGDWGRLFYHGRVREYWIAVVPEKWNIMPTGQDGMTGAKYPASETTMEALIYRQYSPNWQFALPDQYGGQPGPMLYAEVGDTIKVHFKNLDTFYKRPHSMHPHGVHYTPANDGSYIYDDQQPGSAVGVGESYTYTWTAGADSVGFWVYHDHSVDTVDNTVLGMYGLIDIAKPGTPKPQKQMVTFFDEMTPDVTGLPREYDTINGSAFIGNTPTYSAKVGDKVQWVVAALGSDYHIFHIHGHRWEYDGHDSDTLELGPAEAKAVSFTEDAPGLWLVHCHVDAHMMAGMTALYKVATKSGVEPTVSQNKTIPAQAKTPDPSMAGMDMD